MQPPGPLKITAKSRDPLGNPSCAAHISVSTHARGIPISNIYKRACWLLSQRFRFRIYSCQLALSLACNSWDIMDIITPSSHHWHIMFCVPFPTANPAGKIQRRGSVNKNANHPDSCCLFQVSSLLTVLSTTAHLPKHSCRHMYFYVVCVCKQTHVSQLNTRCSRMIKPSSLVIVAFNNDNRLLC